MTTPANTDLAGAVEYATEFAAQIVDFSQDLTKSEAEELSKALRLILTALASKEDQGSSSAKSAARGPSDLMGSTAQHSAGKEEVERLQSVVTAWQSVFEGLEAHLQDRIAMKDPANPEAYLSILRSSVARVHRESEQIVAARWADARRARERVAALEAKLDEAVGRPCTCHPDDNPPTPCARKYALSDCLAAQSSHPGEAVAPTGAAGNLATDTIKSSNPEGAEVEAVARIEKALDEAASRIGKMCSELRPPRMSIPVQADDDDVFITTALKQAADLITSQSQKITRLETQEAENSRFVNEIQRALGDGPDGSNLEVLAGAVRAKLRRADEVIKDVTASLVAACSLLQRGGKKAAASDKIFAQMLADYEASILRARSYFTKGGETS